MTVYIPLMGILYFVGIYALIGLLLLVPLAWWQNRFISGNRSWADGVRWNRAVWQTMLVWPTILGYSIYTEIRYRRKGWL